jgi:hypothetical protein
MHHTPSPSWSASLLRRDLNAKAHKFAHERKLLHDIAPGPNQDTDPLIIFGRSELGPHGNFHPASDLAISANPDWLRRLAKPHTASRRSPARNEWPWRELDSAVSSDALLMNIFCHPRVFSGRTLSPAVANLLNVDRTAQPRFGMNPRVPLRTIRKGRSKPPSESSSRSNTLTDRTEIDLQLGNLFVEAKLTESSFQTSAPRLIERYRDLEAVFDVGRLPRKILYTPVSPPTTEDYSQLEEPTESLISSPALSQSARTVIDGYQLIRNVLAAFAADASFCVLCDSRRHDLIEIWYSVLSAVHYPSFAWRLKLLTWQELASALPKDLQQFLDAKYGIVSE